MRMLVAIMAVAVFATADMCSLWSEKYIGDVNTALEAALDNRNGDKLCLAIDDVYADLINLSINCEKLDETAMMFYIDEIGRISKECKEKR